MYICGKTRLRHGHKFGGKLPTTSENSCNNKNIVQCQIQCTCIRLHVIQNVKHDEYIFPTKAGKGPLVSGSLPNALHHNRTQLRTKPRPLPLPHAPTPQNSCSRCMQRYQRPIMLTASCRRCIQRERRSDKHTSRSAKQCTTRKPSPAPPAGGLKRTQQIQRLGIQPIPLCCSWTAGAVAPPPQSNHQEL